MSAARLTSLLALMALACDPASPTKVGCREAADCLGGRVCTNGLCATPSDPSDAASPLDGDRVRAPANCDGSSWQPIVLGSAEEAASLLVGRWIRCGGGNPPSLSVPTEFAADGRWFSLVHQADGSYARSTAYGKWGRYRVTGPDAVSLYDAAADPDAGAFPSEISQVHFSLNPFIMQFDPALYTLLP